jgi:hypothetical protein
VQERFKSYGPRPKAAANENSGDTGKKKKKKA